MAVTAVIKFGINNDFFEWGKAFYDHQPKARQSGIYELYHGHGLDDPKSLVVVVMAPSPEAMDHFRQRTARLLRHLVIFWNAAKSRFIPIRQKQLFLSLFATLVVSVMLITEARSFRCLWSISS